MPISVIGATSAMAHDSPVSSSLGHAWGALSLSDAQPIVRIENLSHVYQPEGAPPVRALDGIDLTIARGECVALIGANEIGRAHV